MNNFPQFDEIHVISDIHMGGAEPDFQVLRETKRLAGYIRWVGQQQPDKPLALVLNGDVFDTLAEKSSDYVMVDTAVPVVQSIMDNPSFRDIWQALAEFVALNNRQLVFVIGNHDIEIAFPVVQRLIQQRLAGDDLVKKARIEFSTTGAGFSCLVGTARVYCTHGNEVDGWNYNRYEDLAKVGRRLNAGLSLTQKEWRPNAGTRMVKEVMNQVKQRYKWIDLLKPETQAAVGTLVVLDPSQASKIGDLVSIATNKAVSGRDMDQRLSMGDSGTAPDATPAPVRIDQLLGAHLTAGLQQSPRQPASGNSVDDMLLQAEQNLGNKQALQPAADGQLGTGQLIWDRLTGWIRGISQAEALRRAMQDWLAKDKSFDITDPDDTFKDICAEVGNDVDFIVTGHTHLERAIELGGGRFYLNCGTWIRLMQFTPQMLQDEASFQPVYQVLTDGRMESIDKASFFGKPFVMDQTSAVIIRSTAQGVVAQLTHVLGDGSTPPQVIKQFVRA